MKLPSRLQKTLASTWPVRQLTDPSVSGRMGVSQGIFESAAWTVTRDAKGLAEQPANISIWKCGNPQFFNRSTVAGWV